MIDHSCPLCSGPSQFGHICRSCAGNGSFASPKPAPESVGDATAQMAIKMARCIDELRLALQAERASNARLRSALQRKAGSENASRDPEALCTELCEIAHAALNAQAGKAV